VGGEIARVLRGGTHGELVGVGLAQQDGAGRLETGHDGGVVGRNVALEDLRGTGGLDAGGAKHVLDGEGDAQHGAVLAGGAACVGGSGSGQGLLRHQAQISGAPAVHGLDALQHGAGQLYRGDLATPQQALSLVNRQFV
jgi:hypothetical protein